MRSVRYFAVFLVLFILLSPLAYAPEEHLLPLQGTAKLNTVRMEGGNLIIEIYDAPSGGNLVYNSTNDFLNVISGGAYDILLGNGTQPLSLNYGTKYYMDMYINNVDVDFNGSERQVFMSTVGNLSVTTPIRTSSNDTDDALNISNGGSFFSGNVSVNGTYNMTAASGSTRQAGTATILSTDPDDALNVSNGGGNFRGQLGVQNYTSATIPAFTVNYGFNVSGASSEVRTNGTVTILSRLPQALLVQGFNVSGADSALRTNGTVIINNTDADDALNVSNGGGNFRGQLGVQNYTSSPAFTVNYGFNVSGANSAVSTNGTVTMGSTAVIQSTDADDALNVSNGGGNFRGQLGVQNYTSSPAFTVNYGFNVSGADSAVRTNGTITILSKLSQALLVQGFNISGADSSLRTNGTVIINNTDADDALNVSNGGGNFRGQLGVQNYTSATIPAFTVNYGFNVSGANNAMSTNGTVAIRSAAAPAFIVNDLFNVSGATGNTFISGFARIDSGESDDALNVSNGGGNFRGQLGVQNYTSATIPAFTVNYGFNVSGADSALRTNGTVTIVGTQAPAFVVNDLFNISGLTGNTFISGFLRLNSADADDALNVSNGGGNFRGQLGVQNYTSATIPAFTVNYGFNVSGADSAVRTNGTITILSTLSQALLVQGFNISGADSSLRTNGTVIINNTDADDALNVSNGGGNFRGQLGVQNYTSATIPAFTVNYGFNVSGADSALRTNGSMNIISSAIPAFIVNDLFNVSGATGNTFITGFVRIDNGKSDDALNVSRGGTVLGGNPQYADRFTVDNNGAVTIRNPDSDDALNITRGGVNIGNDASTSQHRLIIWDGGTDKCSQIVLFDETGADYFIYVNSTQGRLMISNSSPATCSEGVVVGGQSETS